MVVGLQGKRDKICVTHNRGGSGGNFSISVRGKEK